MVSCGSVGHNTVAVACGLKMFAPEIGIGGISFVPRFKSHCRRMCTWQWPEIHTKVPSGRDRRQAEVLMSGSQLLGQYLAKIVQPTPQIQKKKQKAIENDRQ